MSGPLAEFGSCNSIKFIQTIVYGQEKNFVTRFIRDTLIKTKFWYRCFIFYVFYIEPAKVFVHPKDIWVEVDKKANLSCRGSGDEPITYTWFKNGERILSSAEVIADQPDLVFYNAILRDAEKYHCEVQNHKEPDKSRTARIEVYSKFGTKIKYTLYMLDSSTVNLRL
jgi:hypothetical protein